MSECFICKTCGVQFAATDAPPERCPICDDERQYVGHNGQQWTTLAEMRAGEYHNVIKPVAPGLTGIGTHPGFAIGQRALLVRTPTGNVLWDCISLLDDPTIAAVRALGGISAIAISHPHFYSSVVEWSHTFDAPVYLPAADRQWVMRPDASIHFWDGDTLPLMDGVTVVRCGGHFDGSAALHWAAGAEGRGALLTGDTLQVVSDRRFVTFMYSYPNAIPLPAAAIRRIVGAVEPFAFDTLSGGWWDRIVAPDAKGAVARSAERYIAMIEG